MSNSEPSKTKPKKPKVKKGHPPELTEEFTQPDGWKWDFFKNAQGHYVRFGWTKPDLTGNEKAKGFVVIAPGLSEFCEKYFETIRDLKSDGYAVAIMEWRGQGLSHRHTEDRDRRHSDGFGNDVHDFDLFVEKTEAIRAKNGMQDTPTALLAHSMGGNITLRYIHDNPQKFATATFSAPMIGINLSAAQKKASRPASAFFNSIGKGDWYAPGQGKWSEAKFAISQMALSTDKKRRVIQKHWFKFNPELMYGGVTYRWLMEAMQSCDIVQDKAFLARIKTPCFFAIAEDEIVVDNKAILSAAEHIDGMIIKEYENARHEVLMEKDIIRDQFLTDFKNFAFKM